MAQCVFAAIFFVLCKLAFNRGVDPLNFSWQVLLAAGGLMLLAQLFFDPRKLWDFTPRNFGLLILAAFFGGGMAYAFRFLGIRYSSAVNCSFIGQSSVVFTALLAHFLLKEKLGWQKGTLIMLLLGGCYLVATGGQRLIPRFGDWFFFGSALAFSLAVVAAKLGLESIPALVFTAWRSLLGGLFLGGYLAGIGKLSLQIDWAWVLPVGAVVGLAILTINLALPLTSASYCTMMSAFIPFFTILLAYPLLGEKLNWVQMAGGVIIIASGWLCHCNQSEFADSAPVP